MAATRVGETKQINVKLLKDSSGGKNTYVTRSLGNVNVNLSDADAYLVGEGWGAMTPNPPHEVGVTNKYAISYEP